MSEGLPLTVGVAMVGVAVVWGQGTVSCLTRVRSVRIRAIMNNDVLAALPGGVCTSSSPCRSDRSRGVAGAWSVGGAGHDLAW